MKTFITLILLYIPNFVFACVDSYAPDNWNVTTKAGDVLSLHVYGTGGKTITLVIEEKSMHKITKQIEIKSPEDNQVWLLGSCSVSNEEKVAAFALSDKSAKPGWAKKYYFAYELDTETLRLKEINLNKIKCYDAGYYRL